MGQIQLQVIPYFPSSRAILRVKLRHLDIWNQKRRQNATFYNEKLKGSGVIPPEEADYARHVYQLYVIRSRKRNELMSYLSQEDIQVLVHFPIPIHLQMAYRSLGHRKGDFPIAETCARQVLSLPFYPEMEHSSQEKVIKAIVDFLEGEGCLK